MKNISVKEITLFAFLLSFAVVNAGEHDYMRGEMGAPTHFPVMNIVKADNVIKNYIGKAPVIIVRQQSDSDAVPKRSDLFPAKVGKMFSDPAKLSLIKDTQKEDADDSFVYSSSNSPESSEADTYKKSISDIQLTIKSPQPTEGGGDSFKLSSSSESEN